ncbi:hypothetical protein V6N11_014381 [Hibiscus sabdariffa]|uniref:Uncharacterized protein n=2 Tax=Hibiscus sabdariffa TaxID=183260 RepID=A0ABR2B2S6_9ROSI
MAEAIASVILEQLTAITIDKAREAWSLVRGAEKEVKRLESNFKALQLELEGAEEKEYLDKRVKHWLDKFKDVSYDMEDVLDDWETAVLSLQRDGVESCSSCSVRKWKVCPFISCFSSGSQIVRRYDIATKIKEINEEVDQIVNDKVRFAIEEMAGNSTLDLSSKKARHLRLVIQNCKSSPLYIYGLEKLRSFIVTSDDKTSGDVLQDLFSRSKLLRLLEINSFHLRPEEIVPGMENLIHLRYLSLISCSGLENLPEAVCELIGLRSLNLRDCLNLKKLAVGISKLINLKYLCIKDCPRLTYYPKGIANLTSLETLSGIKMRIDGSDGDQLSIADLENLNLLGGNLCVELIGDSMDWNEARRAKLHKKIYLKRMDLWICSKSINEDEVLQALNPPSNFPVVLFDYQKWFDSYDACLKRLNVRENIRVALIVQQAALQLVDWAEFFGIVSMERGDLDGEKVNKREDIFDFDSFK